jgi:hypothetical protein
MKQGQGSQETLEAPVLGMVLHQRPICKKTEGERRDHPEYLTRIDLYQKDLRKVADT